MKWLIILLAVLSLSTCSEEEPEYVPAPTIIAIDTPQFGIDSLLALDTSQPFNGVILVERDGHQLFYRSYGDADREYHLALHTDAQFMIGSLSKQFTAAIVLREHERGTLSIYDPIGKHLPEIRQPWKDSVRVYHLLSHTHGIRGLNSPLAFRQGSQFAYSNFGYGLLEKVLEHATGKTFSQLSTEFFHDIGLTRTSHPEASTAYPILSYTEQKRDSLVPVRKHIGFPVAAGGFISTASDLALWNTLLHSGKVLHDSTYHMMIGHYALRKHPVFGQQDYGYGISSGRDSIASIGHSGFALGNASINYYFPKSRTSLIVLENIAYGPSLREVYGHHKRLFDLVAHKLQSTSSDGAITMR